MLKTILMDVVIPGRNQGPTPQNTFQFLRPEFTFPMANFVRQFQEVERDFTFHLRVNNIPFQWTGKRECKDNWIYLWHVNTLSQEVGKLFYGTASSMAFSFSDNVNLFCFISDDCFTLMTAVSTINESYLLLRSCLYIVAIHIHNIQTSRDLYFPIAWRMKTSLNTNSKYLISRRKSK